MRLANRASVVGAISRYREAKNALSTPGSRQSRSGLDWMNFFIADVQTGFGSFVAFYLAGLNWPQSRIGEVLAVGGLAGVLSQIPGGALADATSWKRALVALGIVLIGGSAIILALAPTPALAFTAELFHGVTAGILTPAIGAISLGLVGRRAMSSRTGRNFRFAADGHALTAMSMGAAGAYLSQSAIFVAAAILCVPALIALSYIRPEEIDYARARNAATGDRAGKIEKIIDLSKNRGLLLFTGCLVLFQLADASMLPLMGEALAKQTGTPTLLMSGLIITPQIIVAILAPWVGYHSEARGRRPLLLVGFGLEPVRAILLAFTSAYPFLIVAQLLDGMTSAIVTVLTVLVITDLTTGSGRFNFARGAVGAMSGLAASVSTLATGFVYQEFGRLVGFFLIAAVAGAATLMLWTFQLETKPAQYLD
jgi:MFS family permease